MSKKWVSAKKSRRQRVKCVSNHFSALVTSCLIPYLETNVWEDTEENKIFKLRSFGPNPHTSPEGAGLPIWLMRALRHWVATSARKIDSDMVPLGYVSVFPSLSWLADVIAEEILRKNIKVLINLLLSVLTEWLAELLPCLWRDLFCSQLQATVKMRKIL